MCGTVEIAGAKNAALPILAASVLTGGENVFAACPEIVDVSNMMKILQASGCRTRQEGSRIVVNAATVDQCCIPDELMREMRSSMFLVGSLLGRCGEVVISSPGGCRIGARPIDIHIEGLKKLGVAVSRQGEHTVFRAARLKGDMIRLKYPSVGATENLMLAATAAEGTTILQNSAREPEIVDLQNYLNACGGCVRGAGTGTIRIEGKKPLSGCSYRIMPDRIEAGTFLLMALATGGEVLLRGAKQEPLEVLLDLLRDDGCCDIRDDDGMIWVKSRAGILRNRQITTAPYPGFPTDLQPQLTAFLCQHGKGCSVTETIFENRFGYANQLIKMGADIEISPKQVIIKNNHILYGAEVEAEDLRGGAALVIAGLMAQGTTTVQHTKYVKRGYGNFLEKIRALGGDIEEYAE